MKTLPALDLVPLQAHRTGMKVLLTVIVAGLCCLTARAEDWTVNEKTYHNVTVNKVELDTVSIMYDGGITHLNWHDLTPAIQKELSKQHDALLADQKAQQDAQAAADKAAADAAKADADAKAKEIKAESDALAKATEEAQKDYSKTSKGALSGQLFIVSKGGENFKLGDVRVCLFSTGQALALLTESNKQGMAQMRADLPKPMEETTSDADGKFTIPIPISGTKTEYQIYAHATRQVGDQVEEYDWMVSAPRSVDKPFLMTNDNSL